MAHVRNLRSLPSGAVSIAGLLGQRMNRCIEARIYSQEIEPLVTPFRIRNDGPDKFRGEFWGKWFTSLMLAYSYQPTELLRVKADAAVSAILETQDEEGCISTHSKETQHGHWDVWSRKYVMLGLLHYYQEFGGDHVLDAVKCMSHHLAQQIHAGINLGDTGHWAWQGLAPNSVLEPLALLASITQAEEDIIFAEEIVEAWNKSSCYFDEGLALVDKAQDPVLRAAEVGNHKAYEQMSCFEGLCQLYEVTNNQEYLDAAIALAEKIRDEEIMIVGSGSNHETWFDGKRLQTEVLEQPLETCATVTWMKLCFRLLQLTNNSSWADELEKSLLNALPAAMTTDATWWSYYSPLQGERVASHFQFEEIGLSCCVANGPRALLLTHRWAFMQDDLGPLINLYGPSAAELEISGVVVRIEQITEFPVAGDIRIRVHCSEPVYFDLRLRIPAWSRESTIESGAQVSRPRAADYAHIPRTWRDGDEVVLHLDMRTRAHSAPSGAPACALTRGPLVLALDNRLNEKSRKSLRFHQNDDATVEAKLCTTDKAEVQLCCEVPVHYHKVHIIDEDFTIKMCDYASAGNTWSGDNLFRVWLPQPLFLEHAYPADTWKLMYPEEEQRPDIPRARNDFDQ